MKPIDWFLQRWRLRQAAPWIPAGARLLDVGCAGGELFDEIGDRIATGLGIDPHAPERQGKNWRLTRVSALDYLLGTDSAFDAVTFLASAEHLSDGSRTWKACHRVLAPGGRMIFTLPAPPVDAIIGTLIFLRLADGMDFEQHTGLTRKELEQEVTAAGFQLEHESSFQLGLNRLLVFRRT